MRTVGFLAIVFASSLSAQEPPATKPLPSIATRPLRLALPEKVSETDGSRTVVHFVTNRLLITPSKGAEAWTALAPDKLFLKATENPLVGFAVVKHDGSAEKPNDANLAPYKIESFHPRYDVRIRYDENVFPPVVNEVKKGGLDFLDHYWNQNVLIYVHGFNNDWFTAVRRAAQLKRDLKKKTNQDFAIVVYSWPSLGGKGIFGTLAYTDDERRYRQSLPAFSKFLDAILLKNGTTEGRGKRWVLAHSMGNRVFLHGFAEFGRRNEAARRQIPRDLLTRLVFAAPDMEVGDFERHTKYVFAFSETPKPLLYFHAASNIAVNASEIEHWDSRAGVKPVVSDKLLTIDARAARSPWSELGHGYYASNDKMVSLISDYFFNEANPAQSSEIESVDGERWRLK
jgi:hypothetical protein